MANVSKSTPLRKKRLIRKRARRAVHPAGAPTRHPGSAPPSLTRPYAKAMNDLTQLVAETVCGYPNVWGIYSRKSADRAEIVVVATPPVTRMVQYLLDSLAEHPCALASGCRLHCETSLRDEAGFSCIYRRFA